MSTERSPGPNQPWSSPIKQWDGAMPIVMSLIVWLMIAGDILKHGLHALHHDEDGVDHLAMLLMFGQIPIMLWFTAPMRHRIRDILPTLGIQLSLWAVTFAAAVVLT